MVGMTVIGWWRNDVGENVVIATTMIVRVAEITESSSGKKGYTGGYKWEELSV